MKRVVISGLGIVSSLGNNKNEVLDSLQNAKSGITFSEEYKKIGLRSQVHGNIKLNEKELINHKTIRFMGQAAAYAYLSMREAIEDSKLTENIISHDKTGLIVGSGGSSNIDIIEAADLLRSQGIKRVGPYRATRAMASTTSACLSTEYKIKGTSFSVSAACATSAHCIGMGYDLIKFGKQNIMFVGGAEELNWSLTMLFDAMGALSSKYNDVPTQASRPFDEQQDGFVISGGGGILVLEELEHALSRKANIYAEIIGYGASSDGDNMVRPSLDGAIRCMHYALTGIEGKIDYINVHGTSTQVGDINELNALKEVFLDYKPAISSTKSLSGHSQGAAGVHEAIYTLLMLQHGFIAPSINITSRVPEGKEHYIVQQVIKQNIDLALSNSFGFGGVNASLVFKKFVV